MREYEEFSRQEPRKSRGFFFGGVISIIFPLLAVTAGVFLSTQLFASYMNYDPEVTGEPLYVLQDGYRIYNPVFFILSVIKYIGVPDYSEYVFKSMPPVITGIVASIVLWLCKGLFLGKRQRNQHIHGTARWAKVRDLVKFGLVNKYGVVCGELSNAPVTYKIGGENNDKLILHLRNSLWREYITHQPPKAARLLCHSGATNTWVIAPTRSGKGVSCIIPTLLNYGVPYIGWSYNKKSFFFKAFGGKLKFLARTKKTIKGRASVIVFDPKGENWEATAGFRSQFSTCLPFNPMQIDDSHGKPIGTVHYNPILEIPDSKKDAFAWSDMFGEFFFSQNDSGENAFFYKNARDIFTAVIMHVRFSREIPADKKTFTRVLEIFSMPPEESDDPDGGGTGAAMLKKLREEGIHVHDNGEPFPEIHKLIVDAANRSEIMTPKERASVYSTVFSELNNFQDPLIEECTSYSDFSVRDFIEAEHGISLYLIIPYNHIKRISPLFRLLINFIIRVFSDGATNANSQKLSIPCQFILDEFPVLGKFEEIEQNAGVLAGYGVTFMLVSQSLSQIVKLYGEHHAFLDHCKNIVLYTPAKYSDAKEFSESIGNRSVLLDNVSLSGSKMESGGMKNVSLSSQETSVSLISPDELMKLEFNRMILLTQGMAPYKGKKVVYYEDPRFRDIAFRVIPDMEHLMKKVSKLPSCRARKNAMRYPDAKKKASEEEKDSVEIRKVQDTELDFMINDEE